MRYTCRCAGILADAECVAAAVALIGSHGDQVVAAFHIKHEMTERTMLVHATFKPAEVAHDVLLPAAN